MAFIRKSADTRTLKDPVFEIAQMAQADMKVNGDLVVNATIGTLYGEDGRLVAYDSVYHYYDHLDSRIKAKYAAGVAGNANYRNSVYRWVFDNIKIDLPHSVVATPGGTGSINSTMMNILEKGETMILPDNCWSNYALMAEMNSLKIARYSLFKDDHYDMDSIRETIAEVQKSQDKVLILVNDPCHNPTGYSMSVEEWKELIGILNEASEKTPVVLLDDIAYIDYAYNPESRAYMALFNTIAENVMIIVSFSCSKTLTFYGMRCGASIVLARRLRDVQDAEAVFEKTARSTWSNISNSGMETFAWVENEYKEQFLQEKQEYIQLMKERSSIFLKEAAECGLPIYPYKEGFFLTIKGKDPETTKKIHQIFLDNHIYTVLLGKDIRIGICSLPVRKVRGLAGKMKALIEENGLG
ncbi:MAG: aminotransferase class I/II-fold pyridoxal phosphate-dependent enzyme [Solobacterium sp.]|nr:aminotransferase class I/II-fold pyridoxal phosphate-dependent enzyme [Solobacterium sp.]